MEHAIEGRVFSNRLREVADEIESRHAGLDQWSERLDEKQRQLEGALKTLTEQHAEKLRALEARERAVNDVRQIAADRKAAIETLRAAVENEKDKRRHAENVANNLREQVVRLERTLADALARKAVGS